MSTLKSINNRSKTNLYIKVNDQIYQKTIKHLIQVQSFRGTNPTVHIFVIINNMVECSLFTLCYCFVPIEMYSST